MKADAFPLTADSLRPLIRPIHNQAQSRTTSGLMSQEAEVIETTVGEVAGELARRGLDPCDRIIVTIEPDELIPGRREARARVVAAGLSDEDIDRMIKRAQLEVEPPAG